MALAEGDDVIGAFAADRSDDALDVRILQGDFLALMTCSMPITAIFFLNIRP